MNVFCHRDSSTAAARCTGLQDSGLHRWGLNLRVETAWYELVAVLIHKSTAGGPDEASASVLCCYDQRIECKSDQDYCCDLRGTAPHAATRAWRLGQSDKLSRARQGVQVLCNQALGMKFFPGSACGRCDRRNNGNVLIAAMRGLCTQLGQPAAGSWKYYRLKVYVYHLSPTS